MIIRTINRNPDEFFLDIKQLNGFDLQFLQKNEFDHQSNPTINIDLTINGLNLDLEIKKNPPKTQINFTNQ